MAKAHNTNRHTPGRENISYTSINKNYAVQLTGIGNNSIKKLQKVSELVVSHRYALELPILLLLLSVPSKQ